MLENLGVYDESFFIASNEGPKFITRALVLCIRSLRLVCWTRYQLMRCNTSKPLPERIARNVHQELHLKGVAKQSTWVVACQLV